MGRSLIVGSRGVNGRWGRAVGVLGAAGPVGCAGKRQSRQEPEHRASLPAHLSSPHRPGERANKAGVRNTSCTLEAYS